ncbi:MAG: GNAT family N-acetyltransferase [Proteobacteria bacterium]|nr:GNAT family N-acetyltransferase [Pseudomonadota bacterium]
MLTSARKLDDKDIVLNTKVTITKDGSAIHVIAESKRLLIRPVESQDVDFYQDKLWGDSRVLEKFADGLVRLYKDEESKQKGEVNYARNRIVDSNDSWCNRWKNGNPWSGMTVIDKQSNKPIGHVVIGGGELAYFFIPEMWNKGIGTEAVCMLTKAILPALVISGDAGNLPENIEATTRIDHVASQKVLAHAGLVSDRVINKRSFGNQEFERFVFKASVAELVKQYKAIKEEVAKPIVTLFDLQRTNQVDDKVKNVQVEVDHQVQNSKTSAQTANEKKPSHLF